VALGLEQSLKIVVSAVDNASGTLTNIKGLVNTLSSDAATAAQTLDTIGQGLQNTGRSMTRYLTAPVVGGLGLATKAATDFEEKLTILEVALGNNAAAVTNLGEAAKQMGQDVNLPGVFGATDALDAMTDMTKAGFTLEEIGGDLVGYMNGQAQLGGILQAAVLLSAASDLSLQEATNTLITSIHTYDLRAEDALEIANMYVQAADASAASVRELTASVGAAGPSLEFYNMSLDDTLTALAIMADRNIKGAEAGTNLRSMQNSLHRNTARVNDALQALNVTLYDSEGAFRSPIEIIDDVNKAMATLTDQQLATSIKDLFGTYGQLSGISLGKVGVEGWDEMNDKIAKAATVQEVAEARSGTFAAELGKLKDTIETFMVNAGTPFIEDFLRPAVESLQGFVEKLNELNPATLDWLLKISMIAAVTGPALVALGTLARSIASLVTLYQLLAGAQAAAGAAGGVAGMGAAATGAGAAAGAAGLGALGAALTALPTVGGLGVAGAAIYAAQNPEETEKALVGSRDWLRGLIGLPEYDPSLKPWEQLWWNAPRNTSEPSSEVQAMLATPLPGQTDYAGAVRDEYLTAMTNAVESEASLSAENWVTEFEASMAAYDSTMESIGLGGGTALKAGFMYAAEDAGSEFLITIARQLAPELVPYVMEAMAARNATLGPVG